LTQQRIIDAIEANKEGARARNREAELWIGKAYLAGRFLPESKKDALPWLRRAAEQGSQEALELMMDVVKRP
jgi:TPR repeat protein